VNVRPFLAQARAETLLSLRQGESVLLTLVFPLVILGFFSTVEVLDLPGSDRVGFLVPGVLALSVLSTAMVALAISTGFQRSYRVLKRLATTPLGRPALLGAKTASVAAVMTLQVAAVAGLGVALGWRPDPVWGQAVVALLLGTVAFAGLGLLMAGTLRAEVTLAAANGLYLVLLLLGDIVVPLSDLPGWMAGAGRVLPAAALAGLLRDNLGGASGQLGDWAVLLAWAVVAPVLAARWFRWD
jgi:ABC-2 type transport system permease protein